jgi:hypothetical protein
VAHRRHLVAFEHAIERATIDIQNLSRTRDIALGGVQNVQDIAFLDFLQGRQVVETLPGVRWPVRMCPCVERSRTSTGRSSGVSIAWFDSATARSMVFSNSRMLPGQV